MPVTPSPIERRSLGWLRQRRRSAFLLMPAAVGVAGLSVAALWAQANGLGPLVVLAVYCVAVVFASIAGGNITQRLRMTHNSMQHVISLVGGVMLGTALFHLLPHALHGSADGAVTTDSVMTAVVLGIVAMFAMLRLFHHHHHGEESAFQTPQTGESPEPSGIAGCGGAGGEHSSASSSGEGDAGDVGQVRDHQHDHDHGHQHGHAPHGGRASWIGVLVGLMIHTLIDGITLAASVRMDASHGSGTGLLFGFGTFLAVFLHKPLDAISITSMMAASGQSPRHRQWANVAFALTCPLGAAICYAGVASGGPASTAIVAYVLAFSAGVFLCIALSDLLPEMEFHSHDRVTLTSMLLLGLLAAWMLRFLEGDLHGG